MMLPINVGVPPTRFALKARPYFLALLLGQAALVVGRFVIMDFWGGFLTFAALLMGALVISGGTIESQYCLYYVLMCLVIAIFDIILCVERGLHVKYSLLSRRAPLMFNVASVIFLLSPMIELAATALAAYIFLDAQEAEHRWLMTRYGTEASTRSDLGGYGRTQPDRPGFSPFRGECHHLGA